MKLYRIKLCANLCIFSSILDYILIFQQVSPCTSFPLHFLKFIYLNLFIFGCVGSSLLLMGFSSCSEWGLLCCGAQASHCSGFSCCGARALGMQAQQLWLMGSKAQAQQLWHRLSCSTACGIFPDQVSNLCPLHWQADS